MHQVGITYEALIPYTHEQNGRAERTGRLIMTKGRARYATLCSFSTCSLERDYRCSSV